ncbi:MAG: hypothetical protein KGR26_12215, partial [Cyanobacteria bacterium REEB65]|nr:hypothetical protein [Cyanobacteria bacterium REEB65]
MIDWAEEIVTPSTDLERLWSGHLRAGWRAEPFPGFAREDPAADLAVSLRDAVADLAAGAENTPAVQVESLKRQ